MAEKWAHNLVHTPGCSFKTKRGPIIGHEIVAKKRVRNPDRVFTNKKKQVWDTNFDSEWGILPTVAPSLKNMAK